MKLIRKQAGEYLYEFNKTRFLVSKYQGFWYTYIEVTARINGELETYWDCDRCFETKQECIQSIANRFNPTRYQVVLN